MQIRFFQSWRKMPENFHKNSLVTEKTNVPESNFWGKAQSRIERRFVLSLFSLYKVCTTFFLVRFFHNQRSEGCPNKHFHGPTACENFGVWSHPNCLPFCANPENGAKNGGTRFSYASSVSLAAFIAWIVASTIFNSFSSRALSRASIRFLHSLPLFLDG